MTDSALPTRENPYRVGKHQLYYHAGTVPVIVYSGDLEAHEMRAIITAIVGAGTRVIGTIADVGKLGSFGPETRKALLDKSVTDLLQSDTVPIGVFVVNADVVRRAVLKLAMVAARLLSKRAQRMYFLTSRDEAEERAAAYSDEHGGTAQKPAGDPAG